MTFKDCKTRWFHVTVHVFLLVIWFRETDKQHICVNMQLKKWFTQLKLKEQILIRRWKRLYANTFLCTGTAFSGQGTAFGTVTKSPRRLQKTFPVPVIVFHKRLACLNDHCFKMASHDRLKSIQYTQKNAILNYLQPQNISCKGKSDVNF